MELVMFILLLSYSFSFASPTTSTLTFPENETDMLSLIAFKRQITHDPSAALSSWNDTNHVCNWNGVSCRSRKHPGRVTTLDLSSLGLAGFISVAIANLTFLRNLTLADNGFSGMIPPELGRLRRLQVLDLSYNVFHGSFPINLTYCSDLMTLNLANNIALSGKIPIELGSLSKLGYLSLSINSFIGSLPPSIGNLSSLYHLELLRNHLERSIPREIGSLYRLESLLVSGNTLSGVVPSDLFNISSLNQGCSKPDIRYPNIRNFGYPKFRIGVLAIRNPNPKFRISDFRISEISDSDIGLSEYPKYLQTPRHFGYFRIFRIGFSDIFGFRIRIFGYFRVSDSDFRIFSDIYVFRIRIFGYFRISDSDSNILNTLTRGKGGKFGYFGYPNIRIFWIGPSEIRIRKIGYPKNRISDFSDILGSDFQIFGSDFSGSDILNTPTLNHFGLAGNQLEGSLPSTIGTTLPNLQVILLGDNNFEGFIPFSLPNASSLSFVDMSDNNLNGMVPPNLGRLASLSKLNLELNQLTSNSQSLEFLTSLANCSQLSKLSLYHNDLSGELPKSIGNFSTHLQELWLNANSISGSIPLEIGNLVNLTLLALGQNILTGVIPKSIGKLQSLQMLNLRNNSINGNIPSSLGNLTELVYLGLDSNNLDGLVPPNLGNLQRLEELLLGNNNFSGTIPKENFHLASIRICSLSYNSLVGSIPFDATSMQSLTELTISENKLTGEIPSTLGDFQLLEILDFHRNIFNGDIPPSLSNLKGLQQLDLSQNNMSGAIPFFLQSFNLTNLNLSFNHFEGEVPLKGIFKNATITSLEGNDKLCGGIQEFHLPPCPSKVSERRHISTLIKIVIAIASGLLCLFLFTTIVCIYWKVRSRSKKPPLPSSEDQYLRTTYFDLAKATDGFSNANLIGKGAHGSVYKGALGHERPIVAVKLFNLEQQGALMSFKDECEALRNIRHRNLNKILTSCSTIDSKGDDFKALVFEFMPNGNIETWLHSTNNGHDRSETKSLSLRQRLNIIVDVSDALDYLHHDCQIPIIHCDLKPSNILLDVNMVAHVGDFGLARLLSEMGKPLKDHNCSVGIRGTIGYVAPEYGAGGQPSTSGDVYSFGILLLEIFTGKRPTNDMFRDAHNLHKFVEMAYPSRIAEVMDPLLLLQEEESEELESSSRNGIQECITSVLRVGLLCSKELPKERPNIRSVAIEMHAISNLFAGVSAYRE